MVWSLQNKTSFAVKPIVEQILAAGTMSRQEHLQLTSMILSDYKMSDEDRRQINRVFDYIQTGRIKLID